jgi:hypothetical protein
VSVAAGVQRKGPVAAAAVLLLLLLLLLGGLLTHV